MDQGATGQQGLGPDIFDRLYPRVVKMTNGDTLTNVIAMLARGMHGICLTEQGQVYSYERNCYRGKYTKEEDACLYQIKMLINITLYLKASKIKVSIYYNCK